MRLEESTFEEDYNDVIMQIESNSSYGILPSGEKKYMTAAEMKKNYEESFEQFLASQDKYKLDKINDYEEIAMEENIALAEYRRKKLKNHQHQADNGNLDYLTFDEAAMLAKVSRATIYEWGRKK